MVCTQNKQREKGGLETEQCGVQKYREGTQPPKQKNRASFQIAVPSGRGTHTEGGPEWCYNGSTLGERSLASTHTATQRLYKVR